MPKDLEELLVQLRDRSATLNNQTDTLNQRISAIEDRVRDVRAGVEAWVSEPLLGNWRLGWGRKPDKAWGFNVQHDQAVERLALLNAPRAVRLEAASRLAHVVEVMLAKTAEMVEEVDTVLGDMEDADG